MDQSKTIPGLTLAEAAFLASRRLAHLATADAQGQPHIVPICYHFDGQSLVFALDEKPKRVTWRSLRRIRNLIENPRVAVIVDDYAEDWSRLAFVLVRGQARLLEPGAPEHAAAIGPLQIKYPQYRAMVLDQQPIVRIVPTTVTSWGAVETPSAGDLSASGSLERLSVPAVIQGRRSVRAYRDQPVPRPLLDECLSAAGWAPSPHGRQPWRFAVITRPEVKLRMVEAMADEWQRQLTLDNQPPEIVALRLAKSRERILTAPALILFCLYLSDLDRYPDTDRQVAEQTMAVQSLGAAVQNLLLTAFHLGLDGGWMCAPLFCPETVVAALELDHALIPQALITLGYAARDPIRRPRRPLSELVVFDQ